MSKQHRPEGSVDGPTDEPPAGVGSVGDGLSVMSGVDEFLQATGGSGLHPAVGGAGALFSLLGMGLAGRDMEQNGLTAQNGADMYFNAVGASSWALGLVGSEAAPVAAAAAGGYAGGKLLDTASSAIDPNDRGISDRIAERGAGVKHDVDDLMGEDSTLGDVLGVGATVFEVLRPGSFSEHLGAAASDRVQHAVFGDDEPVLARSGAFDRIADLQAQIEAERAEAEAALLAAQAQLAVAQAHLVAAEAQAYADEHGPPGLVETVGDTIDGWLDDGSDLVDTGLDEGGDLWDEAFEAVDELLEGDLPPEEEEADEASDFVRGGVDAVSDLFDGWF